MLQSGYSSVSEGMFLIAPWNGQFVTFSIPTEIGHMGTFLSCNLWENDQSLLKYANKQITWSDEQWRLANETPEGVLNVGGVSVRTHTYISEINEQNWNYIAKHGFLTSPAVDTKVTRTPEDFPSRALVFFLCEWPACCPITHGGLGRLLAVWGNMRGNNFFSQSLQLSSIPNAFVQKGEHMGNWWVPLTRQMKQISRILQCIFFWNEKRTELVVVVGRKCMFCRTNHEWKTQPHWHTNNLPSA